MTDPHAIESPCISVCVLDDDTGFCKGCWRTRDEVAIWSRVDNVTRLEILERLRQRRRAAGLPVGRDRLINMRRKS